MKFKIFILSISILLISPCVYSNDIYEYSDITPDVLIPAEFLANLTNSAFNIIAEGFSNEDINIYIADHDVIIYNAKILLIFFFGAALLKQTDSIESFTPYSLLKSIILLLISLWFIYNIQIIFNHLIELKNMIAAGLKINQKQLINFNNIIQDWYKNIGSTDLISKTEEAFLIVSYTQSMLLSLIAILIIGVVLFLRLVKLQIYQIIAPYMMAAISFKDTISLSLAFIKDYLITYFMIIIIIFIMNKFLEFEGLLTTNYFMVFIQNTLLAVIIVKLRSISLTLIKLGKKGINTVSHIRNNPNKFKTTLNLMRNNLNNRGYASLINNLPSAIPKYFNQRKTNINNLFNKKNWESITSEKIKRSSSQFSKKTFEKFRNNLNNRGYAPVVNKTPSYLKKKYTSLKEIFKKGVENKNE